MKSNYINASLIVFVVAIVTTLTCMRITECNDDIKKLKSALSNIITTSEFQHLLYSQ